MSNAKNRFCFWLAIALILMVTCSPLIYPGMHVYFSAHMITHVVLLLICRSFVGDEYSNRRSSGRAKRVIFLLAEEELARLDGWDRHHVVLAYSIHFQCFAYPYGRCQFDFAFPSAQYAGGRRAVFLAAARSVPRSAYSPAFGGGLFVHGLYLLFPVGVADHFRAGHNLSSIIYGYEPTHERDARQSLGSFPRRRPAGSGTDHVGALLFYLFGRMSVPAETMALNSILQLINQQP